MANMNTEYVGGLNTGSNFNNPGLGLGAIGQTGMSNQQWADNTAGGITGDLTGGMIGDL